MFRLDAFVNTKYVNLTRSTPYSILVGDGPLTFRDIGLKYNFGAILFFR